MHAEQTLALMKIASARNESGFQGARQTQNNAPQQTG